MKRARIAAVVLALAAIPALAMAAAQPAAQVPADCITQGEFAVLVCQYVQHLEGDRNPQSCIDFLKSIDVAPGSGWMADQLLSEETMVELIEQVGIHISSQTPNRCVTRTLAELVFRRYKMVFVHYFPARLNSKNHLDAAIYDEGDVRPISPSVVGFPVP